MTFGLLIKKAFSRALFAAILCLFTFQLRANPLLNINGEEKAVYDAFYGSAESYKYGVSIGPVSMYKSLCFYEDYNRVRIFLTAKGDTGNYIKPLNAFTVSYYYTNAESNSFIPGMSGLDLEEGSNLFMFQDGYLSMSKHLVIYYQLKETLNSREKKIEAHRAYGKILFYKFSIQAGIDNINLGPGEYGMLLSDNSDPYPLVKLQTEDYIDLCGKWDFLIANGWLREKRTYETDPSIADYDNPMIIALRLLYKPFDYIELGATRTILYGGDGKSKYKPEEYPEIVIREEENVAGSKWDNDAYAAYDISLYLPLNRYLNFIKIFKLYYQHGCTDIKAFWQDENKDYKGIKFLREARQSGLFMSTRNSVLRLEYFKNCNDFYTHSSYRNHGYSYNGMGLGYPFGKGIKSYLARYRYYFKDDLSVEAAFRYYYMNDPVEPEMNPEGNKMRRRAFSIGLHYSITNFLYVEPYLSVEKAENTDLTPFTPLFTTKEENSTFYTSGISLSLRI